MPVSTERKPSPEELVKQKFPDAFVLDDVDWIHIMNRRRVEETCPHCSQPWNHKVVDHMRGSLGSGNSEENAWLDAARRLGLI